MTVVERGKVWADSSSWLKGRAAPSERMQLIGAPTM
jgi:hypothetical protein